MPSGDFEIVPKLDGIDGASADTQHAKEIDVLSYSNGLSQTAATSVGCGGARARRPAFMSVH